VPLWWVARGVVAVELLALVASRDTGASLIYPDSRQGLLALAVAVAVSAGIGLAGRRRPLPFRSLRIAADVLLALVLLAVVPIGVDRVRERLDRTTGVPQLEVQPGLAYNGTPVQNMYAYDGKGRLLHDVRLYDQDGNPISIGGRDPLRRPVTTKDGTNVLNAFPIRFFEPGTHKVARPNLGPRRLHPEPLSARR
jgi:hypothetical protein